MSAHGIVRIAAIGLLLLVASSGAFAQSVVGVLGIAREIAPIEKRLQDVREVPVNGYVFRVGTLNGRRVVVGRSGAGKVNAAIVTTLLIGQFNPSAVLFSGTAGGIDPALRQGDVVIGATVAHHDAGLQAADGIRRRGMRNAVTGDLDPLLVPAPESLLAVARRSAQALQLPSIRTPDGQDRPPRIIEGVIVTGDVFLADSGRRGQLREALGATAVEMEGAAVVQTCRQFGVPCLIIRSITDRADDNASANYEQFLAAASENAATLVARIIAGLEEPATSALAQVPEDLRVAMRARDTAFYAVDPAVWEQYTAPAFTTVQQDGSFMTRAQRLVNLRTQTPRPYVPRSREQNERRGDLVIARFFSGGFWVLEVWTRESGTWMVLMSQVTTAKP